MIVLLDFGVRIFNRSAIVPSSSIHHCLPFVRGKRDALKTAMKPPMNCHETAILHPLV